MLKTAAALIGLWPLWLGAQTAPPGTEVLVFDLDIQGDEVRINKPVNISKHRGYDSQPHFSADGQAVYFTHSEGEQTEIYRHTLSDKKSAAFTHSPESEYSPTPMPDGDLISVVRVDADGSQHVYALHPNAELDSVSAQKRSTVTQVGYHNWGADGSLWMFVINEQQGDLYYQRPDNKAVKLSANIGRALVTDATRSQLHYVDKNPETPMIRALDVKTLDSRPVLALPEGVEDFTLDAAGNYWCGQNNDLYISSPDKKSWRKIWQFNIPGLSGISRLNINPQRTKLALVFNETQ